jgi:flagellar biosynthesis protein FlhG
MSNRKPTRTVSITSGKGGVGKSTFVAHTAASLGQQGHQVLILDGDLGMANLDIMFGVRPTQTLYDVIRGHATVEEVCINVAPNVDLIPGGSGIYDLQKLSHFHKKSILDQISTMEKSYDFMLIDTAPGIADHVLDLNAAAQEIVVVVTPDPSSIADAYALMKVLNMKHHETRFSIVANLVRDENDAQQIFKRLSDVAARFLPIHLDDRGFVVADPEMRRSTRMGELIYNVSPQAPASRGFRQFSEKLKDSRDVQGVKGGLQFFWMQLAGVA